MTTQSGAIIRAATDEGGSPWPSAQNHAPWRATVTPAVAAALTLPSVAEVATSATELWDVVVVGAGIAGLSAAVATATAGARTLALEAAPAIGAGATGRNAGILSAGINMGLADLPPDSPEREMWPATTRELLALAAEATQPDSLLSARLTGALSLAESAAAARRLAREGRARLALGLRAERWTPAQVAERTGGRLDTRGVVEAMWLPDEGRINPLTLLARTAEHGRPAGAPRGGGGRGRGEGGGAGPGAENGPAGARRVRLADGHEISARGLVVATGPVLEPTARIFAVAYALDLPDDFPLFWDAAPYTYCDYRPGGGYLVSSGGRYGRAGGSANEAAYYQRLARGAQRWLPELAQALPSHAWAVDLDVAADLTPRLRDLGERAPGYAIEGLGALGVLPGRILARQVGERLVNALSA